MAHITKDELEVFNKVLHAAACSHFTADRPLFIQASKLLQGLLEQGEAQPVAWILQFSPDSHKTLRWSPGDSNVQSIPLFTSR